MRLLYVVFLSVALYAIVHAQAPIITSCPNVTTPSCDTVNNPDSMLTSGCTDLPLENLRPVQQGTGCDREDDFEFTVTDPCNGMETSCSFTVLRNQPNAPPSLFQGVDPRVPLFGGVLPCDSDTSSSAHGTPVFIDGCDGFIQGEESNVQVDDGCVTQINRTFTARDSCMAEISVFQQLFVLTDMSDPNLTVPADTQYIGLISNVPPPGPEVGEASCTDDCSMTNMNWTDSVNGNVVSRLFFCYDECGNSASGTQLITVVGAPTTAPPTTQVPPTTAAPTSVSGDPHFRGFYGQTYDFHGRPNAVFNLITMQDLQVNSLFLDSDLIKRTKLKTYMGSIGIMAHDRKALIEVACNREEGERIIRYNGKDVRPGQHFNFGNGRFKLTHADNSRSVLVTPVVQISIRFSSSTYSSCHLNLRAKLLAKPPVPLHGVLGQTADVATRDLVGEGDQGKGIVDGTWKDYRLLSDDLFGKDFIYNLYTGQSVDYSNLEPLDLDPAWGD